MLKPFLDKLLRRTRTDDDEILKPMPLPADTDGPESMRVVGAMPEQTSTPSPGDEARGLRAAIATHRDNPELKALLLENMAHEPAELLAFAVESGDEDAAVLVFQGVIQSTWHPSTSGGWQDRWQRALDAGLAPRVAFLAMAKAWIDHALVNGMAEAVVRSAAQSGMREDRQDFPAFWAAAQAVVAKHKMIEAVVREKFRAAVRAQG